MHSCVSRRFTYLGLPSFFTKKLVKYPRVYREFSLLLYRSEALRQPSLLTLVVAGSVEAGIEAYVVATKSFDLNP